MLFYLASGSTLALVVMSFIFAWTWKKTEHQGNALGAVLYAAAAVLMAIIATFTAP